MVYTIDISVNNEDVEKYTDQDIEEMIEEMLYNKRIDSRVKVIQKFQMCK